MGVPTWTEAGDPGPCFWPVCLSVSSVTLSEMSRDWECEAGGSASLLSPERGGLGAGPHPTRSSPPDLDKLDNEKKELIQGDIAALYRFYSRHLDFPDHDSLVVLFAQVRLAPLGWGMGYGGSSRILWHLQMPGTCCG